MLLNMGVGSQALSCPAWMVAAVASSSLDVRQPGRAWRRLQWPHYQARGAFMTAAAEKVDTDQPINQFLQCHSGIVARLRGLCELPRLAADANRARSIAADLLALFDGPVLEHHADEEKELFPAVLRSATPGEEFKRVEALANRLVHEHRLIEQMWKNIEPAVRHAARGKPAEVDALVAGELVSAYLMHANFEEACFLPLAEQILGRDGNHMAALGLSLHLRHATQPVGYI